MNSGRPRGGAHVIVLGNEKGGSGKSTTAMHIVVGLLSQGRRVAAIDLDARQRSLSRYLENRRTFSDAHGVALSMPAHAVVARSDFPSVDAAQAEERARFTDTLSAMAAEAEVVVIDCPGSDTYLARLAHAHADTIVTPLNDSFVDLDLLARVEGDGLEVAKPSLYAEMVWEARKRRAMADRGSIDWIVMRNRVGMLNARNKARVERVLAKLAKRIGFRFIAGLSERVIYRELFLKGLTLMDLREAGLAQSGLGNLGSLSMSHVAARQELRRLIEALNLPRGASALQHAV